MARRARGKLGIVAEDEGPSAVRIAHGDLRPVTIAGVHGETVIVQRSVSIVERLALAGDLGDDVARLLSAAEWFVEQGEIAELRGRLVRSKLAEASPASPDAKSQARVQLAHAYDRMGGDCWGVVFDVLIWETPPTPDRLALLRAGLYAIAVWRAGG